MAGLAAAHGGGVKPAPCIAIVGAESTGKTSLAQALALHLTEMTGLRCAFVPEVLREWCDERGRTPRAEEQQAIAHEQSRRIAQARHGHELVVADTTALMTAVYSELLFADTSLYAMALEAHRDYALTLLTALDLPWTPDGLQRDGPHVREPVDRTVRQALLRAGLQWSVVAGQGQARLGAALDALTPLLLTLQPPRAGLFTRLQARQAALPEWQWVCEKCDAPECEHRSLKGWAGGPDQ